MNCTNRFQDTGVKEDFLSTKTLQHYISVLIGLWDTSGGHKSSAMWKVTGTIDHDHNKHSTPSGFYSVTMSE